MSTVGPLWKMLNKMGLSPCIFGQKAVMVVLFGRKPTQFDQTTIQRYSYFGAPLSIPTLSHPKFFLSLR